LHTIEVLPKPAEANLYTIEVVLKPIKILPNPIEVGSVKKVGEEKKRVKFEE